MPIYGSDTADMAIFTVNNYFYSIVIIYDALTQDFALAETQSLLKPSHC